MIAFINPWFLCGLLAIGVPIWLHLQRKDQTVVNLFSTMRFLEDQPIASRPPLRLRDLLLFLLRVLALLLIVAALARPYLARNPGDMVSSTVYVLDNSLSRQAEHGLDRDRSYILNHLGSDSRSQMAVVEVRGQPKVIVNFSDSADDARAKLQALQPSIERGSMLAGLREADTLLKQSIGGQKQIVVLTDLQKNQWIENASSPPFLAPGEVTFATLPQSDSRPNAFIQEPKAQRAFTSDSSIVEFSTTLGHTDGFPADGMFTLTENDLDITHKPVSLDAKVPRVTALFAWESDPNQWILGSAKLDSTPDDLPGDNAAYFACPPLKEGRIAILSHSLYLNTALSSEVSKGHWLAEKIEPDDLQDKVAHPEQDAEVLVIDGNYLQSDLARQLARRYLQTGRGVFVTVGELSTLLDGFLEELSFSPQTRLAPDAHAPLQPIRYYAADSAVFKPFSRDDFTNLMDVRVGDSVHLIARDAKPILFSQSGTPILYEGTKYGGRFLLATFPFERNRTDWVLHPSFVPFIDFAMESLRPQPNLVSTVEPSEVWQIKLPENLPVKTVSLFDHKQLVDRQPALSGHRAAVRAPDHPGVFTLTYDSDPAIQQALVVNVPEKESDLLYFRTEPDVIKAWTVSAADLKNKDANPLSEAEPVIRDAIIDKENLWWSILIAGFIALFSEIILGASVLSLNAQEFLRGRTLDREQ